MQFGIHLPQAGDQASPTKIRRAALQAEDSAVTDVWVSDHVILPNGASYPPSPLFYDPVVTLTWVAAVTKRVRLGTSVMVLPMRHPLPLAREFGTLQDYSEGRVILGAGVGWCEEEFSALGVPFKERGRRMDEGMALMRAVWSHDPVTFPTKYISANVMDMRMTPLPKVRIPFWIGGVADAQIRRTIEQADGWHGSRQTPAEAAPFIQRIRAARPEPEFTISMRVRWDGTDIGALRDRVAEFAAVGVQHIMVEPNSRETDDWDAVIEGTIKVAAG